MLLRLLRHTLRPYRALLVGIVVLQLVGTLANLYLPSLNAKIIDQGVATGNTGYIWRTGGVMLAISALQIVCTIIAVNLGARTAMGFGRDLRGRIFDRVLTFSAREVNRFGAPSLITRTTNDVQQVQMLVLLSCTMFVAAPITMVGGIVMAVRENARLSWLVAVAVPVLALAIGLIIRKMGPLFRQMQTRIDAVNRILREQITGIRVVRAFVREPYEQDRFGVANGDLTQTATTVGRYMASLFPVVMLILNASSVAVLWFGARLIDSGDLQIGQLTAFLTYLVQILMSVMMATFLLMIAPRAAVCAERIGEVLETESSVVPPTAPVTQLPGRGVVAFEQAEFTYPGADFPVLCGVEFTARAGQTTAIVGSTGSGKTTLVSLVPRLFDATGGRVLVDGTDVREIEPELLWSRIGLVPQKAFLFSGTVASNLRYGNPEATDEELWEALRIAQAADFVSEMPGQLEAPIAQGGSNVSGGQRQRLSIARALVKRPEIYVFDDSFSALDTATDARLRAALAESTGDAAVIIVGQRVSTIADADQIVVLEDGRTVGIGTHIELLESCPTYREIVESQLSAEEAVA
ncbi:ATP-binding cassette subfamily B protein [Friedmanniella endophytica]|uniref:ATP-binding cassette subfamily B protein n=1 Tax=Microlunatus kandeliicorticis TaxID=1759536 RepID=A0A7W3IQU9_9ACTN|nr:ABC transporter ATP-binding protein [Microlunatus kandeliicorticis]MBA8793547.1 ATP-binding cassette subfamily B protein [Microlunatus kandeliicorticis]